MLSAGGPASPSVAQLFAQRAFNLQCQTGPVTELLLTWVIHSSNNSTEY